LIGLDKNRYGDVSGDVYTYIYPVIFARNPVAYGLGDLGISWNLQNLKTKGQ
jgi:hypothetical protein